MQIRDFQIATTQHSAGKKGSAPGWQTSASAGQRLSSTLVEKALGFLAGKRLSSTLVKDSRLLGRTTQLFGWKKAQLHAGKHGSFAGQRLSSTLVKKAQLHAGKLSASCRTTTQLFGWKNTAVLPDNTALGLENRTWLSTGRRQCDRARNGNKGSNGDSARMATRRVTDTTAARCRRLTRQKVSQMR